MDARKTALDVFIFFGLYVFSFVESEMIATNTFTVTDHSPKGKGIWQTIATCNTYFPGKSYGPNEAYMFTRFGVPVLTYQDYLGGNWFEIDPDKMWVISRIGYGSGGDNLPYNLQFDHDVWLGTGTPTGDCHQFTDLQEARDFAANASTLSDTPADTLVSSSDLDIVSTGHAGSQGVCRFSFPGIKYGTQETVVLVSFSVPVTYQSDYIGSTVLQAADDSTWYIVKNVYGQENSLDYYMNFNFISSDTDVSSAHCSLYASQTDAVAASNLLGPTTTQSTITLVQPPTIVPATVSGTTSGSYTGPYSTGASVSHWTTSTSTKSNKSAGFLFESQGMRNIYVLKNNIWKKTTNRLRCARHCLADVNCISVFYFEARSECTAHSMIYGSGTPMQGVSYYIVE